MSIFIVIIYYYISLYIEIESKNSTLIDFNLSLVRTNFLIALVLTINIEFISLILSKFRVYLARINSLEDLIAYKSYSSIYSLLKSNLKLFISI